MLNYTCEKFLYFVSLYKESVYYLLLKYLIYFFIILFIFSYDLWTDRARVRHDVK